jgi:hypothetical protein
VPKNDKKCHVRKGGIPGPEGKYERDYTFNGCGRTVTALPTKKVNNLGEFFQKSME